MSAMDRVAALIQERNRIDAELSTCGGTPSEKACWT